MGRLASAFDAILAGVGYAAPCIITYLAHRANQDRNNLCSRDGQMLEAQRFRAAVIAGKLRFA